MPKRQSSSEASTIAGRMMRLFRSLAPGTNLGMSFSIGGGADRVSFTLADLKTLCASVLAQDETKGQAPKKRRAKAAR